jgi:hypothetical protein
MRAALNTVAAHFVVRAGEDAAGTRSERDAERARRAALVRRTVAAWSRAHAGAAGTVSTISAAIPAAATPPGYSPFTV